MGGPDPGRRLKTLETANEIFELLRIHGDCDLMTVAEELDLAKSTVHGYLTTLESQGLVYQEQGDYYLGANLLTLGGQVRHRRRSYSLIIEKVEYVSDQTSERAQFVIEEGGRGFHLHVAKGSKGVEADSKIGKKNYLHASAAGKAILAWSSEIKVDGVVDKWGVPQLTERTITEQDVLKEELETIRQQGYAYNNEESIEGLRAIGVPIRSDDEMIGAISVSGPSHRLTGDKFENKVPNFLLGISNELELRLSYEDQF